MNPIFAATDRRIAREVAEADCRRCAREQAAAEPPVTYAGALAAAFADSARMFLCPTCGNKRCPKASDHDLPCTGSNEPGQPGSVYP